MRLRSRVIVLASLVFLLPIVAAADDGPTLYKQLCESCHEAGTERAGAKRAAS